MDNLLRRTVSTFSGVRIGSTVRAGVKRLSALDRVTAGMIIKGVWWFRDGLDGRRLRDGLVRLLQSRPWLAGRLTAEGVVYDAEGEVPFVESSLPECRAETVLAESNALDRFAHPLSVAAFRRGQASPLTVSLVHVSDGALLYVQGAHVCMDGSSFYGMMADWARLCRGEAIEPVEAACRLTDPDFADDPAPAAHAEACGYVRVGWRVLARIMWNTLCGLSRRRFAVRLTGEQVAGLIERVNARLGTHYGRHVVLSALLAAAEVRLGGLDAGVACRHVSVVNLRGRMAGIPLRFDGNAVYNIVSPVFSSSDKVEVVAGMIDRTLRSLFVNGGERLTEVMRCYMSVIRDRLPYVPFDVGGMYARRSPVSYVNDFLGFSVYALDFGTGTPAAVLPPDLPDKVRLWPLPPQQGGGVEILFTGWLAGRWARCGDPLALLTALSEGKEPLG